MPKKRNATAFMIAVTTKESVTWEDRGCCGSYQLVSLDTIDVDFVIFKKFPELVGFRPKAIDIKLQFADWS